MPVSQMEQSRALKSGYWTDGDFAPTIRRSQIPPTTLPVCAGYVLAGRRLDQLRSTESWRLIEAFPGNADAAIVMMQPRIGGLMERQGVGVGDPIPRTVHWIASVAVAGLGTPPTLITRACELPDGVLLLSWIFNCKTPSTKVGAAPTKATVAGCPPTDTQVF